MNRQKPPFVERRVLSPFETAAYLGRSKAWFTDHANRLYETGFPQPLPIVGGYDKQAIDDWLDRLGRGREPFDFDAAWTKAANG